MTKERRATQDWLDWFAYLALRCVVCIIQSTSLETCDRICRVLARTVDATGLRRKVTDENLTLVYGDLAQDKRKMVRMAMWHHLLLMVCEIAHAPRKIHRTNWREHYFMPEKSPVTKLILNDGPAVLVTGHFGNFEVAGHTLGLLGMPTTTIARPLDNPYIDRWISEFRSMNGQQMLAKEGSSSAVQELLAEGGSLALLADQYGGTKGTWIDFFGHPTSCHKALALFVLSAGAPMVVNYTRRLDRPLKFEMSATGIVDPAVEDASTAPHLQSVVALTEWYNQCLEEAVRKAPEQYWWLHRRWREISPLQLKRLEARRRRKAAAQAAA